MRTSPRRVAFDVLQAVSTEDAYANLLLPNRLRTAALTGADAGFATELCYGTLRRRGWYDLVIARAARRAVDTIDAPVLDVLRLGAHQLLGMGIPPHAAVDESVRLALSLRLGRAKGFVNAALRRVSERSEAEWLSLLLSDARDPLERLSIEHAHPRWVVAALESALAGQGRQHEIGALLAADNVPARVSLVALPGLADDALSAPGAERCEYSPLGLRAPSGDPGANPRVRFGTVRVQDEGSQLAALALSRARPIDRGERWLDLCAGPGGKAALLGAEAAQSGAHLLASEISPARTELVRRAVAPLGTSVDVRTADGLTLGADPAERYDRIMLDAPCSGLGALRRRPEARWRKSERDVVELAALQERLLAAALSVLAPGGVLAYVTCSPHPRETTQVVEAVLGKHPEIERLDTADVLDRLSMRPLDARAGHGAVQLWPHRHATDAMFIQLLAAPRRS
ncbi:MAG: transcription antitermination factor NusB [Microcella sp.]|uniref:RsmB/NOP family class I SAM-dependent RNA methyltransferase n=1 Tax=Microcella sp. TaxID=1913979 RepID=UPI003316300D